MRVDIWSDVVCPWCYIGKRRFTFDAHRLVHLARERGVQERVLERLFEAYFTEGRPVSALPSADWLRPCALHAMVGR